MNKATDKRTITADPKAIFKALKKFQKNGTIEYIEHGNTRDGRDYLKITLPIALTHVIIFQEKEDGSYTSVRFLSQWDNSDGTLNAEQIHDYNANALWGKAYMGDDNDIHLEMMIDLQQPILKKHLRQIYKRWVGIQVGFHIKYIEPSIKQMLIDDDVNIPQLLS